MIEDGFDLRYTKGHIYNVKVFCNLCNDWVIINKLFTDCVFCGNHIEWDWSEFPES